MKRFRRLSAFVMVLTLLLSLSVNVWAADYDAASMEDLWSAFNDTSGEDVNINLTANIDGTAEGGGYYGVSGQEGISYTIGSENGSTLGNIFVSGGESVTVDTDVDGGIHFDSVDATVNGDVDGDLSAYEADVAVNGDVDGDLSAYQADVAVSGDVDGELHADNATVDVDGDVNGDLYANEATVDVGGDVNGSVSAGLDSTVDIAGDVNAQGEYSWAGIDAYENAVVNVGGDVNAKDGNPDDVDYSDPTAYSDGSTGIYASGEATVNVGGNVTGGDSYGTYGYGGTGISVGDSATVNVAGNVTGGNVTTDPETVAEEYCNSMGGTAIAMYGTATVNVGGNATGGDTNGDSGTGGNGLTVYSSESDAEAGSVNVGGTVSGGDGAPDIFLGKETENAPVPEISVGSSETIEGYGFTEEELEQLIADIEATYTVKERTLDDLFNELLCMISYAEPGDEIKVNMTCYRVFSTKVIEAAKEAEVTLIIKWYGGEDLVIDKNFSAEIDVDYIQLSELAELLKK